MTRDVDDKLTILACDMGLRPANAPTLADIHPFIRHIERSQDGLVINFDEGGADQVAAFVVAERLCCAELQWQLSSAPPVLRVTASAEQLEALEELIKFS